jgi:hypothetical protein
MRELHEGELGLSHSEILNIFETKFGVIYFTITSRNAHWLI